MCCHFLMFVAVLKPLKSNTKLYMMKIKLPKLNTIKYIRSKMLMSKTLFWADVSAIYLEILSSLISFVPNTMTITGT